MNASKFIDRVPVDEDRDVVDAYPDNEEVDETLL
jgi:hypothetical protein